MRPDAVDQPRHVCHLSAQDALDPLLFQSPLEDREDALDGVGVGAVAGREHVLKAELLHPLCGSITAMHCEVVHDEAYVIVEVSGPELVQPELERFLPP